MTTQTPSQISSIIFLDIDGTLLDASYQSNEPNLAADIQNLQSKKNLTFAINSNRSIEDIIPIAEQFCITGPLIGENGIFVYAPLTKQTTFLLEDNRLTELKAAKKNLELALRQSISHLLNGRMIHWHDIDTVQAVTNKHTSSAYNEGDIIILNNVFRRYTISAHLLCMMDGTLTPLPRRHAAQVVEYTRKQSDKYDLHVEYDAEFSNILIYPKDASKRNAVRHIANLHPNSRLFSIGDSMSDHRMTEGVGTFLTTSNTTDEVKEKAKVVSVHPHAKGVKELLEHIKLKGDTYEEISNRRHGVSSRP